MQRAENAIERDANFEALEMTWKSGLWHIQYKRAPSTSTSTRIPHPFLPSFKLLLMGSFKHTNANVLRSIPYNIREWISSHAAEHIESSY